MTTIKISAMQVRGDQGVFAMLGGEWVGVSEPGSDELLTELPEVGDVVEAGTERVTVVGGTVTEAQIETLRTEAAQAGDDKQVRICDAALEKGEESSEWRECASVIAAGQG